MSISYFLPRLSGFFVFLLSATVLIATTLLIFLNTQPERKHISVNSFPTPFSARILTYTEPINNYQISYPSEWHVDNSIPGIVSLQFGGAHITIDSANSSHITLPIEAWVRKINKQMAEDPGRPSYSSLITILRKDNVLKNIPGIVVIDNSFYAEVGQEYLFPHKNSVFSISYDYYTDNSEFGGQNDDILAQINQILSTFHFLESSSIPPPTSSVWTTYSDPKLAFSVTFPSNWTIKNISDSDVSFSAPGQQNTDSDTGILVSTDAWWQPTGNLPDSQSKFNSFINNCSSVTPTTCAQKNNEFYKFEKQVTVAGLPAFQTYGGCCMDIGRHIFVYNGDTAYRITLYNVGLKENEFRNLDVFNRFLSTFKFTN